MHRIALVALVMLLALPGAARALCVEHLPFVGIAQRVDLAAVVRIVEVDGTRLHARVERVLAGAAGLQGERIVIDGTGMRNRFPPDGPIPGSRWAIALRYTLVRYDSVWVPPSYCSTAVLRVEGEEAIGAIVGSRRRWRPPRWRGLRALHPRRGVGGGGTHQFRGAVPVGGSTAPFTVDRLQARDARNGGARLRGPHPSRGTLARAVNQNSRALALTSGGRAMR